MNTPLEPRLNICFGDDPDEIVTIVEQPCPVDHPLALAAAQHGPAEPAGGAACPPPAALPSGGRHLAHPRETRSCNRLQRF